MSPTRRAFARAAAVGLAALTAIATIGVVPAGAAAQQYQPVTTLLQAEFMAALSPTTPPAGVNVASCRLSRAHPRPVILVNGTTQVMESSFGYLGPIIANAGYCVYGYNYGGDANSALQAIGPVVDAAYSLANEVNRVKAYTGASKVDLVGYSQGGLVSELYTKFLGASNVNSVTALAPTTHGTTLSGIATLGIELGVIGLVGMACPACADQVIGSAIVTKLSQGPIAQPGVRYTVIETTQEEVVTPVGSSFINEPGVLNEYLQSFNHSDSSEHITLPYDPVTASLTLSSLANVIPSSR